MMHTSVASALEQPNVNAYNCKGNATRNRRLGGRTVRLSVVQTITGGIPVPTGNR